LADVQLIVQFWIWIGYRTPSFYIFGYELDMESMKKFWIGPGLQNFHIHIPLRQTSHRLPNEMFIANA